MIGESFHSKRILFKFLSGEICIFIKEELKNIQKEQRFQTISENNVNISKQKNIIEHETIQTQSTNDNKSDKNESSVPKTEVKKFN